MRSRKRLRIAGELKECYLSNLIKNMSWLPAEVLEVVPKRDVSWYSPVTYILPMMSVAMPNPIVEFVPPAVCTHWKMPLLWYLSIKTSSTPRAVLETFPKVAVALKAPVIYKLLLASVAISYAFSDPAPVVDCTHWKNDQMKLFKYPKKENWEELLKRPVYKDPDLESKVE